MANRIIRQEFNFVNTLVTDASENYQAAVKIDADDFNNATAYFEILAQNANGSAQTVDLDRGDDDDLANVEEVKSLSIPGSTSSWTLIRSTSFSLNSTKIFYRFQLNSVDISIQAARIIVIQNAAEITATQTQIEIGVYEVIDTLTGENTYYPFTNPKIWKYESAKFDPTPTFKLAFKALAENSMGTISVALQESSDAAFTSPSEIANSIVSFTEAANPGYYESSNFTLNNNYYHRLVYAGIDDMYGLTIWNAKIVATQTDGSGIAKLQNEYLLINTGQDESVDTGLQDFQTLYDADEWDDGGGNPPIFYHEHSASASNSQSHLEDSGGEIANSEITGANLQRSSAITLSDDEEIDSYIEQSA